MTAAAEAGMKEETEVSAMQTVTDEVAVFEKSALEEVRVWREQFRGRELVHARVWFTNVDGEKIPTKKGLALTPALAVKVARAMLALAEEALAEEEAI
jgi:hypothetical protein